MAMAMHDCLYSARASGAGVNVDNVRRRDRSALLTRLAAGGRRTKSLRPAPRARAQCSRFSPRDKRVVQEGPRDKHTVQEGPRDNRAVLEGPCDKRAVLDS